MKVAVAISHPAFEREVLSALRHQGQEVVRRCLDDFDVAQVPSDIPIYADQHFHARHPRTILITSIRDLNLPEVRTHTIGLIGPAGAPGVSLVALNLAVALEAALIDAAPHPAIATMTGVRDGRWHGVDLYCPPLLPMALQLAQISSRNTVIDLGDGPIQECDELIVVVAAHPLSVERYLSRDFGSHRLVLNRMEPGAIGQTAHRMIDRSASEVIVIPRDDRACNEAFTGALPLKAVAAKSAMVRAIETLAGIKKEPSRGRIVAVG